MIERPPVLSEDARAALTAAASGAARANRPRWLIYLGAFAVTGAIVFALFNLTRRVSAETALTAGRARLTELKAEVDKIKAIQDADAAVGGDRAAPDSRMADRISHLGTDNGLTFGSVTEGDDQRGTPSKSVKRKRYDFRLNNQPAEAIFTWVKRVTAELGGVQLNRIELSPADGNDGKPGWNASVTFTRWERVQ
jgi:hypothetical protein